MGAGFLCQLVALIFALIWSKFAPNVVAVALLTFVYMGIGWLDDWQILRYKSNKGPILPDEVNFTDNGGGAFLSLDVGQSGEYQYQPLGSISDSFGLFLLDFGGICPCG
jgi:hypothetical protein